MTRRSFCWRLVQFRASKHLEITDAAAETLNAFRAQNQLPLRRGAQPLAYLDEPDPSKDAGLSLRLYLLVESAFSQGELPAKCRQSAP